MKERERRGHPAKAGISGVTEIDLESEVDRERRIEHRYIERERRIEHR